MKFKAAVSKWLNGELTDKQLEKKIGPEGVLKLQRRVFDAVAAKTATFKEHRTLQ